MDDALCIENVSGRELEAEGVIYDALILRFAAVADLSGS